MPFTRRDAFLTMGLAGLAQASTTTPAGAQSAASAASTAFDSLTYRPRFPRARPRPLTDRLGDMLSVLDFGAVGDGRADDTAAFQAAADAAAAGGKALHVPATGSAYRITDTVQIRCRRVVGDANYLSSRNSGTLIRFDPAVVTDMKPCFAIADGMYNAGGFEQITVQGVTNYARERLGTVIDGRRLPDYSAFAPGVCAFGVFGVNQPTFRNVATDGVKVGLYLDSKNGHVTSYDCSWNGLIGIYCHRNSEDYFFMGGQIGGSFACIVFGTSDQANHNGGISLNMYRVHMGFSPYGFYQVKDSDFKGYCQTVMGRLDSVRFERIGEAIFQFLPQSVTRWLAIDSLGMSWSPIHRDYPKPPPNGWVCNLPPEIIPYAEQQQYMMRFGTLGENVNISWLGEFMPLARSRFADNPRGIALIETLDCGDSSDLGSLGGDIEIRNGARPDSWNRYRTGPAARKGDLQLSCDATPSANLLLCPEEPSNWTVRSPADNAPARLAAAAFREAGAITVGASGDAGRAPAPPLDFLEQLGPNPTLLRLQTGPKGAVFRLPVAAGRLDGGGRNIALSLWAVGAAMVSRFELVGGGALYNTRLDGSKGWARLLCVDQGPGDAAVAALLIEVEPNRICLVGGIMASFDMPRPYNPRPVPRLRGGLALDGAATGPAAPAAGPAEPLPARPAGYVTVDIDGVPRKIAYY
ncbi:glycosyl hydrolase family 28-related protein [Ancylobacter lacus]|uniref:glycosyl hydrolase family 28-related protein n=1 Tax=Ancylobacter lacus TaxID=2579970 RepID=UPI001BCB145A|nr:glycosyl hydrolase family 28-related protein [Ancylobacter lacus]MBS7538487.1 hypothetical protein [Ancylobacter lacus]